MVVDVTEQDFQTQVLDRSRELPVVVDFWAEWCGPCRALTPLLERATAARPGKVVLAKVDTDANPSISQAFGIQGIPAVKAFRDGAVVDEFVGAQPPAIVERFFDGLVPSEADALVESGDEQSLRHALELEPGRADAAVALARLLYARGEADEALSLLETVPGSFEADGLAARIRLERGEGVDPKLVVQAGRAFAALDEGLHQQALELLIDALGNADGRGPTQGAGSGDAVGRDELRKVIVGVLDELGVEHPLAREYRRKLATALY